MKYLSGIKLLAWAETIRGIGWGFFEALMPIFLFSFTGSYAESGILSSVFDIVYILALPLVGSLADKISSKTILLIGLAIYPFIGLSYFTAGATGIVLFIVLARVMNGVSYALDSVGRETYFRRTSPDGKVASIFGYFDTIANFWWILSVFASMYLVAIFEIYWLFLALVPTHIIAFIMVSHLTPDRVEKFKDGFARALKEGVFFSLWREAKSWSKGLKLMGFFTFFLGFISTIASFIIPIAAYKSGANLQEIILITALYALPSVFGIKLGAFGDKEKIHAIFLSLIFLASIFIMLAVGSSYVVQLVGAFGIGLALELSSLTTIGITNTLITPNHYGRLSGAMATLSDLGGLMGPIALGLMLDTFGNLSSFITMAVITLGVFAILFAKRKLLNRVDLKRVGIV